jgi:hypothetical protein
VAPVTTVREARERAEREAFLRLLSERDGLAAIRRYEHSNVPRSAMPLEVFLVRLARCDPNGDVTRWVAGHHTDPHNHVRRAVARYLGKRPDPEFAEVLDVLLDDEDEWTRNEAAKAATRTPGAAVTDSLLRALQRDGKSWPTRMSLVEALDPKDPAAQARLREIADSDPNFLVRREARAAVARGLRSPAQTRRRRYLLTAVRLVVIITVCLGAAQLVDLQALTWVLLFSALAAPPVLGFIEASIERSESGTMAAAIRRIIGRRRAAGVYLAALGLGVMAAALAGGSIVQVLIAGGLAAMIVRQFRKMVTVD